MEVTWDSEPVVYSPDQSIIEWESMSDQEFIIQLHEALITPRVPNFVGCRVPVRNKLNIEFFRKELEDYHNKQVVSFSEFEFPTGAMGPIPENPHVKIIKVCESTKYDGQVY